MIIFKDSKTKILNKNKTFHKIKTKHNQYLSTTKKKYIGQTKTVKSEKEIHA